MSADSPPDRELTDKEADALLDRVLERAQQRGDVNEDDVVSRINRRGFLKKGGAAVGGLELLSASVGSAESASVESVAAPDWSNATGNSGTESEPFANLYAQNAYHESVETGRVSIDAAATVYVRSDGDDANDGLTESSAKATIMNAIESAPLQSSDSLVIVDVQEAATFNERLDVERRHPEVRIVGSGQATTEINGEDGAPTDFYGCDVTLDSLTLSGGNKVRVNQNAELTLSNATVSGQTASGINSKYSYVRVGPDSTVDVTGTGATKAIESHGTRFDVSGDIRGGDRVCELEEGATLFLQGCTIAGEGAASTNYLVAISEGGYAKLDRNSEFKDADIGVYEFGAPSSCEIEDGLTFTNVNKQHKMSTTGAGYIRDGNAAENLQKVVSPSTLPSPAGLGTGDYQGLLAHHGTAGSQLLKYFCRPADDWLIAGVKEYADPAAGDLEPRERAYDTTNDRWLYKDAGGTVHYWNADGTL